MTHTIAILIHLAFAVSPDFQASVQSEMNAIYSATPVRFQVLTEDSHMQLGPVTDVVYVEVGGQCVASKRSTSGALATTASVDGVVYPLMKVDCDKLASYVGYVPAVPKAMARVLAHEMLHYLLQEPHHASEGLFQASISSWDLKEGAKLLRTAETERVKARFTGSL